MQPAERLAEAAHELRGPLQSLSVWVDLLERQLPEPPPPVARALAGIRKSVDQQARIVETLLEPRR